MFASGFVVDVRLAIDDKSARNQGRNPTTGWQDADSHGKAPSHTQTSSNVSQTPSVTPSMEHLTPLISLRKLAD
jgi:hypothetical protein